MDMMILRRDTKSKPAPSRPTPHSGERERKGRIQNQSQTMQRPRWLWHDPGLSTVIIGPWQNKTRKRHCKSLGKFDQQRTALRK